MATREDCIRAARAAGNLSREESVRVVDNLMAERVKVDRAKAEGSINSADSILAEAWQQRMNEAKIRQAMQKKHTALNIRSRQRINDFVSRAKSEGYAASDVIEADMVGSNKRFTGARDSADSRRQAIYKDVAGSMQNELEALGEPVMKSLKHDDAFKANVVREIITPQSTGSDTARSVADIFSRYMEMMRLRAGKFY